MRTLNSQAEDFHAWGYLQNALAVLPELTMLNTELLAVQAILGMTIVLQGTSNSYPCLVLISTALKIAQSMKLHRQNQGSSLSVAEVEQRKRIFWIAYVFDKDISLRTGDPPAQDDDDMDVDLPEETTELDAVGASSVNFLNLRIELAIIQGQIYKRLASANASRHSEKERSMAAKELDARLDAWRSSVPPEFTGDYSINASVSSSLPICLHTVILKFTYFNALIAIHRSLVAGSHFQIGFTETTAQPQSWGTILQGVPICLTEARKAMQLLPMIPQGDYACVWLLLHSIFSASTIILSHVISNSAHTLVNEDLGLVQPVLRLLETLRKRGENADAVRMEDTLSEMWREAHLVIRNMEGQKEKNSDYGEDAQKTNGNIRDNIKTVEDFKSRIENLSAAQCKVYRASRRLYT